MSVPGDVAVPDVASTHDDALSSWPAWLLAAVPLLALVIATALSLLRWDLVVLTLPLALVIHVPLAIWDSRTVKRAGHGELLGWALLLVPVYLFKRQKRAGLAREPWIAWIVAVLVAYLGSGFVLSYGEGHSGVSRLTVDDLTTEISRDVAEQIDVDPSAVTITCPGVPLQPKVEQPFTCTATTTGGSHATLSVTVHGDGSWTSHYVEQWQTTTQG